MWSRLVEGIKALFSRKHSYVPSEEKPKDVEATPVSPPPPPPLKETVPSVPENVEGQIDYKKWCRSSMEISGQFEGQGVDWGNPVGNFDDAGLTCGLLGFTWRWNNQPPMILEFVKTHGVERLKALMPNTWGYYYDAALQGESKGMKIVSKWSSGSKVKEPYRSELNAFWCSEEMKEIQVVKAWEMMGKFAKEKTLKGQEFFGLKEPSFGHFCYWFDQAVLNGQGKTVPFQRVTARQVDEAMVWCLTVGGYNKTSIRACARVWDDQLNVASEDQKVLFYMAYLRAIKSRRDFMATTMTRRGTLALGIGTVNEKRFVLPWQVKR